MQGDAQVVAGFYLLAFHAEVAHHERAAGGCAQLEVTVDVSHGTCLCALHQDGCANHWLAIVSRGHGSIDLCLCQGHSHAQEQPGDKHHESFFHKSLSFY